VNKRELIIISDLHIGGDEIIEDFSCEKELISFLHKKGEYNGDLELLILGDFLDIWKIEDTIGKQLGFTINRHQKVFDTFKEFSKKHKITLVPGNHDHALIYNKAYQADLAKYGITVSPTQFFKRDFDYKGGNFKIIGEHGNQVEPSTEFPKFDMPTDSSLAYYLNKTLVYNLMKIGTKHKSPYWLRNMDNVDTELIPYWTLSKYFYYELGPILKAVLIPMLILFGLAVPYFIFDVITEFYQPHFLKPLLILLDTNTFFKILIFLLYFDMVIVAIFVFFWFVKRDFRKRLREYGIHDFGEILIARHRAYKKRARDVSDGKNDFNEKADFYVTGHTHIAGLYTFDDKKVSFVDTGSWKQLMKRIPTRLRFPSVYVPYFNLSYVTFKVLDGEMVVSLKNWPKDFETKLTVLESFALKSKYIPKPVMNDEVVSELRFPLS